MDKPLEIPDVVYKYRDWNDCNHRMILLNNEVYLNSPRDFNDPFDCRITVNFLSLNTKEKIHDFVEVSIERDMELLLVENRDIEFKKKNLETKLLTDLKGFQEYYQEGWFKFHDERLGIISLSKRWDSILMWSHYANKHQGFCVGFFEEKLRESGQFGRGGMVAYNEDLEFPFLDPMESDRLERVIIETQYKAYEWQYEEEYRLFKIFYEGPPSINGRKSFFKDEVLAEVILGINISPAFKEDIISICRKKNIKVYQAKKVPFYFKIEREEI